MRRDEFPPRRELSTLDPRRAARGRVWLRPLAAYDALRSAVPGIILTGHPTERLPNTLNVSFPGVLGSAVLAAAPELAASTGSACHEGGETPSAALTAMGRDAATALGAVRLSLGRSTTREHVDRAAGVLARAWRSVRPEQTRHRR